MNSDYIDISNQNQKRHSPALRVAFIIDELWVIADYLNVARRAEEGDDLEAGTDRGSARLLSDCRQRLVALHDDLLFIRGYLEQSASDHTPPTAAVKQGQRLGSQGNTVYVVAAIALCTGLVSWLGLGS